MNTIHTFFDRLGDMAITLDEARNAVGDGVIYTPDYGPREDGVITGVSATSVFVRYRGDQHSKATLPRDLVFLLASRDAHG